MSRHARFLSAYLAPTERGYCRGLVQGLNWVAGKVPEGARVRALIKSSNSTSIQIAERRLERKRSAFGLQFFSGLPPTSSRTQPAQALTSPANPQTAFPQTGEAAYLAVAQGRFQGQMARVDALDSKVATLMQIALAEVGFALAMLTLRATTLESLPVWAWLIWIACGLTALVALTQGFRAIRVRDWSSFPQPEDTWVAARQPGPLGWDLSMTLDSAFRKNRRALECKAGLTDQAFLAVAFQTAVTAVAVGALIWA